MPSGSPTRNSPPRAFLGGATRRLIRQPKPNNQTTKDMKIRHLFAEEELQRRIDMRAEKILEILSIDALPEGARTEEVKRLEKEIETLCNEASAN